MFCQKKQNMPIFHEILNQLFKIPEYWNAFLFFMKNVVVSISLFYKENIFPVSIN